ncbi:MAG: AraC family transcriptional regulator [Bacillota bacterium]|nr:AraC family transcriptional regulator [Bacillota bacterium]
MAFELVPIKRELEIEGFNSIYYFEFTKNFFHMPECHDFWEMVYIDSGNITALTNGTVCTLSQGQVIFHKPMEMHSHISDRKSPNNTLVISFTCKSPAMDFFDGKIFALDEKSKKILSIFLSECKLALKELPGNFDNKSPLDFSDAPPGSIQLMECYFTEFLFSVMRSLSAGFPKVKEPREVTENTITQLLMQYLIKNLYSKVTLGRICEEFHMSKSTICKIFKDHTDTGIIDYFNNIKMTEARRLIREGEKNMTQIAETLGYPCIHEFSRAFRRTIGISPMNYKKSIR